MVQSQLEARGIADIAVLEAMKKIPLHLFALEENQDYAYEDHPPQSIAWSKVKLVLVSI